MNLLWISLSLLLSQLRKEASLNSTRNATETTPSDSIIHIAGKTIQNANTNNKNTDNNTTGQPFVSITINTQQLEEEEADTSTNAIGIEGQLSNLRIGLNILPVGLLVAFFSNPKDK